MMVLQQNGDIMLVKAIVIEVGYRIDFLSVELEQIIRESNV